MSRGIVWLAGAKTRNGRPRGQPALPAFGVVRMWEFPMNQEDIMEKYLGLNHLVGTLPERAPAGQEDLDGHCGLETQGTVQEVSWRVCCKHGAAVQCGVPYVSPPYHLPTRESQHLAPVVQML